MQIISEPATRTIEVQDIDMHFATGQPLTVTLFPEDSIQQDANEIRIQYAGTRRGDVSMRA